MTSRTRRYGEKGDSFRAFGAEFQITGVERMSLQLVASFYEEEGFNSIAEFIMLWEQIHPRRKFQPNQKVYAHYFKRIAET